MHNDPKEQIIFGESTERELRILAKRVMNNGKARLSFFERQQARDLGLSKALDANGNIDLNVAANLAHQTGVSTRISPNVKVASMWSLTPENTLETRAMLDATNKSHRGTMDLRAADYGEGDLGRHMRFCKMQGRTSCSVCHGIGIEGMNRAQNNKSRDNV